MNTIDAIYKRRAVKHFDTSHRLSHEEEHKLLQATIQSPTSYNIQHWRFVIIRDDDLRKKIRTEIAYDQAQVSESSLLVLFTADTKAWNKSPERYCADAPKDISDMLLTMLHSFYDGREWLQRDEAQRSIGIAMQTLMLTAQDMGYQSCPMIGFDIEKLATLINLPSDHVIGPMVAIGKSTRESRPKNHQIPLNELVIENKF